MKSNYSHYHNHTACEQSTHTERDRRFIHTTPHHAIHKHHPTTLDSCTATPLYQDCPHQSILHKVHQLFCLGATFSVLEFPPRSPHHGSQSTSANKTCNPLVTPSPLRTPHPHDPPFSPSVGGGACPATEMHLIT